MNNVELKHKVGLVVIYISPVDVLIKMDILSVKDYENWRFGRVPYLERVCKTNLNKLSLIIKEIRNTRGKGI